MRGDIRIGQASVPDVRRAICCQIGSPGKMVGIADTLGFLRLK
jgi:hypothetical protein